MNIKVEDSKVGRGWRYQCKGCNYQVGIDKAFPKRCPGCGAAGWWGHLVTLAGAGPKTAQKVPGHDSGTAEAWDKTSAEELDGGGVLSQLNKPPKGSQGKSGRKQRPVPGGLINQLSQQGLSSRQVAANLARLGFNLSYKSVQRYFKREKQGDLLQ